MKKIPTLFVRDPATNLRHVRDEVTPGCEWVLAGEGVATRKYDGTCVLISDGEAWARREVKPGKNPPADFILVDNDAVTGKMFGWEPAAQSGYARYVAEAIGGQRLADGTYELCGPKVQGNPEGYETHVLVPHGCWNLEDCPRDFAGLAHWLPTIVWEGVVWHHPDGRKAKLKRRDFPAA